MEDISEYGRIMSMVFEGKRTWYGSFKSFKNAGQKSWRSRSADADLVHGTLFENKLEITDGRDEKR